MDVRPYSEKDAKLVYWIHEHAFDGLDEANLVRSLHDDDGGAILSLVAVWDTDLVGHILFSPVEIHPAPVASRRLAALAPMAVLPDFQGQGVGETLVRHGLDLLREDGWDGVVVLGHPKYYPRFGFEPASTFGLSFPTSVPDDAFMALPLRDGGLDTCAGEVIYHKAFKLGGA